MCDRSTVEPIAGSHPAPSPPPQQASMIRPPGRFGACPGGASVARALAQLVDATLHLVHIGESTLPLGSSCASWDWLRMRRGQSWSRPAAMRPRALYVWPGCTCAYIVMCPHTGQQEPVDELGGVARDVLHLASCPVVLVPPAEDQRPWHRDAWCCRMTAARRRPPSWARPGIGPSGRCGVARSIWPPPGCPVEPGAITAPRYEDQAHYERPTWASEFLQRACYVNPPEEMRKCVWRSRWETRQRRSSTPPVTIKPTLSCFAGAAIWAAIIHLWSKMSSGRCPVRS